MFPGTAPKATPNEVVERERTSGLNTDARHNDAMNTAAVPTPSTEPDERPSATSCHFRHSPSVRPREAFSLVNAGVVVLRRGIGRRLGR